MQTIKYEHVFPLLKTCDFSPLEHQASGVSYTLPLSILSPFWCDLSLSFDVISLSPFDINFQEGFFWIFVTNGFGPWVTEQSNKLNGMLVEDKIHWVELDQKNAETSGKMSFL